jgi:hypothetical protein
MEFTTLYIFIFLCFIYSNIWKPKSSATVPLAGKDGFLAKIKFVSKAKIWLRDGTLKYKGKMFRLWTPDGYLHIACPEQFQELNQLGEDQLRVAFTDVVNCKPLLSESVLVMSCS